MKMKRLISFVIVLLLVCGMPVSAFAMDDNQAGNTVPIIHEEETMNTNKGTVTTNYGTIEINDGDVSINDGDVSINNGDVGTNDGDVGTNNGTVVLNDGTVDINNGTVEINFGTVKTNEITGDVTNYNTGDVETNYGTVTYVKGNIENNEEITFYGVQVDGSLLQKEVGVELNLKEKFSKEGYVLAGYIMNWRMDDDRGLVSMETPKKTDDYIYSLDHPNVLTLIWMAISGSGNGSAAEGEKPEYFGPGCYISLNGKQYILTEIKGEDYYLASCEEYTQEELAEAGELLESLLTEEQLSHVTGEAGILEGELNELFFGGGSRIVFPCDIGMIFY